MNPNGNDWGERLRNWLPPLIVVVAGIFALVFKDEPKAAGIAWVIALIVAIVWWLDRNRRWTVLERWIVLLLIIAVGIIWGYFVWQTLQPYLEPRFEISALNTLDGDTNAYELTDMLIWNQDSLVQYGVGITFTLEIVPKYDGKQEFGSVVALISGDSGNPPTEMPLWDTFDNKSKAQRIDLTLPQLLYASGLQQNSNPPSNPFRPGDLPFQQARLIVQIARKAAKTHSWDSEEITIRNAPWEQRTALVRRNDRREVDVYVRNLGGPGEFTVRYRLARFETLIDPSTTIEAWNEPRELVYLERGEFFTDTVPLPSGLAQGRYLVEIYAVKRQNFVRFEDTSDTWENLNSLNSPWWFGRYPTDILDFVETSDLLGDATIKAEWERLRDEGVDLGLAIERDEEVTSATGTAGLRQVFQEGEIYVHDGQAYTLYGPILDHYRELGGVQYERLGFPISPIQTVTSSLGTEGYMIEFEGQGSPHPPSVIYASRKGIAATWQWIAWVYSNDHGGHGGWLGFPLADEQYYADSTVQMFEGGYIVYYYPKVGEERDWSRPPVAYPYLASRGTLFDVHAQQLWQDTGVQVQPGDRVTIVQVGGAWTNAESVGEWVDANGDASSGLKDYRMLPSAFAGTLIGRIGEDEENMFSVGRWGTVTSPVEGSLYLAMNDSEYEDNAGFITVQIMVERSE